jgi:hypothetical protein
MKKIVIVLLTCFSPGLLFGQLENTRWKATLIIENPVNTIFDFKKDTVSLYTVADSTLIEIMKYSINDTSFTLLKLDGQSDCNNSTPGKYRYQVTEDRLNLAMIEDDCPDRSSVINNTKWSRWKDHPEVKVDEAILKQYAGVYELDDAHPITITLENGRLYAEGPNNGLPKSMFTAESETRFFLKIAGVEMDFVKDDNGNVVKLISHEEKDYELRKVK